MVDMMTLASNFLNCYLGPPILGTNLDCVAVTRHSFDDTNDVNQSIVYDTFPEHNIDYNITNGPSLCHLFLQKISFGLRWVRHKLSEG